MARRRFIADEVHGDRAAVTGQNAEHLARVLRARVGQEYEIAGEGTVRVGKITSVEDGRVEFELGDEVESGGNRPFPTEGKERAPITLVLAIFKFDRFEWAVEKATELGVAQVIPVIARRTDAHLAKAAEKRVERWKRIAHEASQQSRRTAPPEISDPVKLKDAVSFDAGLKMVCAESEEQTTIRDVLAGRSGATGVHAIALAVGPEGGWTVDELQLFAKNAWVSVTLGPTILRAETAVVAALAITNALVG